MYQSTGGRHNYEGGNYIATGYRMYEGQVVWMSSRTTNPSVREEKIEGNTQQIKEAWMYVILSLRGKKFIQTIKVEVGDDWWIRHARHKRRRDTQRY